MPGSTWYNFLLSFSFIACVAGLYLLSISKQDEVNEAKETEHLLMMLVFGYWMVHCVAVGIPKIGLLECETLLLSLKVTAILTYLLTFSCVLSLPLHLIASRRVQTE